MLMIWCISVKYDLNQRRDVPKCQNVHEGVVKGLNDQSHGKQVRDLVK